MTYQSDKVKRDQIEAAVKAAGEVLKSFPRNAVGLASDETKATTAYREAKTLYDREFARLRAFNKAFVKKWRKEIAEERKAQGY